MRSRYDVQMGLEQVAEVHVRMATAMLKWKSDVEFVMTRLLMEAAVHMMSAEDVAEHSGYSTKQVRRMWTARGLDFRKGKRLMAKDAAEALANNAELMGIEPHEMDLTSPLAYLPMGEALKKKFLETRISQVTELPDEFDLERFIEANSWETEDHYQVVDVDALRASMGNS